jgi:hypothetical protein
VPCGGDYDSSVAHVRARWAVAGAAAAEGGTAASVVWRHRSGERRA